MTEQTIAIDRAVLTEMINHATAGLPNESCGYLAGQNGQISRFYPMTNIDASPEHFSFDPKEQFTVLKQARADQLALVAVYHSHPETPARLSEEDLRLLNDPKMIYIIVSLEKNGTDTKAFRIQKSADTIHILSVDIQVVGD